jgi:hypothetical protein
MSDSFFAPPSFSTERETSAEGSAARAGATAETIARESASSAAIDIWQKRNVMECSVERQYWIDGNKFEYKSSGRDPEA